MILCNFHLSSFCAISHDNIQSLTTHEDILMLIIVVIWNLAEDCYKNWTAWSDSCFQKSDLSLAPYDINQRSVPIMLTITTAHPSSALPEIIHQCYLKRNLLPESIVSSRLKVTFSSFQGFFPLPSCIRSWWNICTSTPDITVNVSPGYSITRLNPSWVWISCIVSMYKELSCWMIHNGAAASKQSLSLIHWRTRGTGKCFDKDQVCPLKPPLTKQKASVLSSSGCSFPGN